MTSTGEKCRQEVDRIVTLNCERASFHVDVCADSAGGRPVIRAYDYYTQSCRCVYYNMSVDESRASQLSHAEADFFHYTAK